MPLHRGQSPHYTLNLGQRTLDRYTQLTASAVARFSRRTRSAVTAPENTAARVEIAPFGVEVATDIVDALSFRGATAIITPATQCCAGIIIVTIRRGNEALAFHTVPEACTPVDY